MEGSSTLFGFLAMVQLQWSARALVVLVEWPPCFLCTRVCVRVLVGENATSTLTVEVSWVVQKLFSPTLTAAALHKVRAPRRRHNHLVPSFPSHPFCYRPCLSQPIPFSFIIIPAARNSAPQPSPILCEKGVVPVDCAVAPPTL